MERRSEEEREREIGNGWAPVTWKAVFDKDKEKFYHQDKMRFAAFFK